VLLLPPKRTTHHELTEEGTMAKKSTTGESKPRQPRRPHVVLDESAQAMVADVIGELGLPRKTVMEAASALASDAIVEGLASRVGAGKLSEAREQVERLERMLGVTEAEDEPAAEHVDPDAIPED
jgi:hypothetical protein